MGGKIFIEKFTHSEIKPVNQMIKSHTAMVRVLEIGVFFRPTFYNIDIYLTIILNASLIEFNQ
jgi:hypothetical protein